MPYANIDNIRFYYEDHSPAKFKELTTLVFLHGFTLDHRLWTAQVQYFKEKYRIIVPDARGHGLSESTKTDYGRSNRVEDVYKLIQHLNLDRFHLIGLSMGGSTAIGYALEFPQQLQSLTLVSSGAAGYAIGKKISRIDDIARTEGVEAARQKWKEITLSWYTHEKQQVKNLMQIMMDEHPGHIWLDPQRGHYPKMKDLDNVHQITVPTLIIAGELDPIFVPLSKSLHEKMPHSKLQVIDGVGHMVNLETPDQFNQLLDTFLSAQPTTY